MKKLIPLIWILLFFNSCTADENEPRIDKIKQLSGNNPAGKAWQIISYITTTNYQSDDINTFQTYDSWLSSPAFIRDNLTIIFPNGNVHIDTGELKSSEEPQVYKGLQFWKLNTLQDSVSIVDYIGTPSLEGTWGIDVTEENITLLLENRDRRFKGSLLNIEVIFDAVN